MTKPGVTPLMHELRALFESLLAMSPRERREALEAMPDAALRQRVEALLAADRPTTGAVTDRLDQAIAAICDGVGGEAEPERALGQQVGPYRLTRVLGSGGSGTVYRGEREDGGFPRVVAIKLLSRVIRSEVELRIVAREQRALASLDHPNVARLIDGGAIDGQPYLIMEMVEGRTLLDHAATEGLDARARVQLFAAVCDGVQAAHQALIVHRDIKPANVMVSRDGQPKLLDFGVAKLLDADAPPTQTLAGLTPAYAAPEQFDGGPITTGTDVYSLGMVLHELLTGERRRGNDTTRASELVRRQPSADPQRARFLRGDLDNVLRKAMQSEPADRYASAGELAQDLRAFLDGRAVQAHPPSGWYRTEKLLRRHPKASLAIAALVLGLIATAGIAVDQALNAWGAERKALASAAQANDVRDLLLGLFEPLKTGVPVDEQPNVATLFDRAEIAMAENRTLQPRARAELMMLFADVNDRLGRTEKMRAQLDEAQRIAAEHLQPTDPIAVKIALEQPIGTIQGNDLAAGEAALVRIEARLDERPEHLDLWIDVMNFRALLASRDNRQTDALALKRRELALREARYGPVSVKVANGYNNLGFGLEAIGDYQEAAKAYRRSREVHAQLRSPRSVEATVPLGNLAAAVGNAGALQESLQLFEQALANYASVDGAPREHAATHSNASCRVATTIHPRTAQAACARALEINRGAYGPDSQDVGLSWRLEAHRLIRLGDLPGARAAHAQAQARLGSTQVKSWRARLLTAAGEIALLEGDPRRAIGAFDAAIPLASGAYPKHFEPYLHAMHALACHRAAADCAKSSYAAALAALSADEYVAAIAFHPELLPAHLALADIKIADGNTLAARDRLSRAVNAAEAIDPDHPDLVAAHAMLAALHPTARP